MSRNNKNIYVVLVVVLLISITIGYAVINTTLNINGKSNISKNTWDIYFDNIKITNGSVTAVKIPTIEDSTTVDFEAQLNLPGDFYEFTVDVVNNGTIDAMIDSVEKTPDLTSSQQKYLNYIIEYQNGEQIQSKQLVSKDSFVRLKVRVEFKKDITASELPKNTETLNLGFTVNYVQSDGTGSSIKDNGVFKVIPTANGSLEEVGTIVTIGTEKFYTIGTEGDNVKLLSMYNLYVGSECTSSSYCTPYGEEATGKQDSTMLGYVTGQSVRKGTTAFSNTNSTYAGSIVEGYVNNYKAIIESEYGVDVVEARLITKDELTSEDIGCSEKDCTCKTAPSFIYSTSYWSGSTLDDSLVWYVHSFSSFAIFDYSSDGVIGVRPVIVIPKSEIVQLIEFTIDGTTYYAEEEMTWKEWVGSKYDTAGNLIITVTSCYGNADNECEYVWVDEIGDYYVNRLHYFVAPQLSFDTIINGYEYTKGMND